MKQTLQESFSANYLNFLVFKISKTLNDNELLLNYFKIKESNNNSANILVINLLRQYLMMVQIFIRLGLPVTLEDISIDVIAGKSTDSPEVVQNLHSNLKFLKAKYQRLFDYSRINQLAAADAYIRYLKRTSNDIIVIDQINPFDFVFDYQSGQLPYYPLINTPKARALIRNSIKLSDTAIAYYHISSSEISEVLEYLSRYDVIIFG